MNTFGWAMMALGLFLVLYSVAFLVRPKGNSGKDKLGCGFVIAAAVVWSIALTQYLNSSSAGLRLGIGAALVLPALAALFKGGRNRMLPAVISFVLAIVLASSAFPTLKERIKPTKARVEALDTAKQIQSLRAKVRRREGHLNSLRAANSRLKSELKSLDIADFDAAMADPEGKRIMEELSDVKKMLEEAEPKLEKERSMLEALESKQRQLERKARAEELAGDDIDAEILLDSEKLTSPATVESFAEREEMRDLFEENK